MKKTIYITILLSFLLSCKSERKQNDAEQTAIPEVKLSKLEQLYLLPTDSVLNFYDLLNDSITELPDLSPYRIRSLNLSYNLIDINLIDETVLALFPQGIEVLNLSNNKLNGDFFIGSTKYRTEVNDSLTLKEVDISYNKLNRLAIGFPLYRIIASHNDLTYVSVNYTNVQYLDISYNPNLSNKVNFWHNKIDTIVRDGIANDKPLEGPIHLRAITD